MQTITKYSKTLIGITLKTINHNAIKVFFPNVVHTIVHLRINMFDTKEDAAAHAQTYVEVAWEEFRRKFGCVLSKNNRR